VARIVCIIIFSFNCAPPVDYFGNNVDLSSERIYLTRLRNDDKNKDKYILVFNEQRGNPTKHARGIITSHHSKSFCSTCANYSTCIFSLPYIKIRTIYTYICSITCSISSTCIYKVCIRLRVR